MQQAGVTRIPVDIKPGMEDAARRILWETMDKPPSLKFEDGRCVVYVPPEVGSALVDGGVVPWHQPTKKVH